MDLDFKIDAELEKIKELSRQAKRIDAYERQINIVNDLHDSFDRIHHLILRITVKHMASNENDL